MSDKKKEWQMTDISSGILQLTKEGAGILYDPANLRNEISVPAKLIRAHKLPEGATITGPAHGGNEHVGAADHGGQVPGAWGRATQRAGSILRRRPFPYSVLDPAPSVELPDLQVAKPDLVTMVLQADVAFLATEAGVFVDLLAMLR